MNFLEAKTYLFEKLAPSKIMALASSVNDYVMVRNVSCLIYNDAIYLRLIKILERQSSYIKILVWLYVIVAFKLRVKQRF